MPYDPTRDISIILRHQKNGAYIASPTFSQYPYCWLRDGAFIAYAMTKAGEYESAAAFHTWVARAVNKLERHILELIEEQGKGGTPEHSHMLPARFTLDGDWEEDGWPSFQLDGYGQWLFSLAHYAEHQTLSDEMIYAARLTADYICAFWDEPCFDAWEEGRTQQHTSTLASLCAGLKAAASILDSSYADVAANVWRFVSERCVMNGHYGKAVRNGAVDASLLWIATPFNLVDADAPTFRATLGKIEQNLLGEGLIRYKADTFYGGGDWVLLTAWLAWHYANQGKPERAVVLWEWIGKQRSVSGALPEQVATSRTDQWFLDYWTKRWGPSAELLLWSHAMVIIAGDALNKVGQEVVV